jgi:hypothetical protein
MPHKLIIVSGTGSGIAPWAEDPLHPFQRLLASEDIEVARHPVTGLPFRWSTKLSGLPFIGRDEWPRASYELEEFIEPFPFRDLNFLGHSHGGQPIIIMAARLLGKRQLRTNCTLATPVRADVPTFQAACNFRYWQHLYDPKRDWIATLKKSLGQLADGDWSLQRSYKVAGIINRPIDGMRHSRMLDDRSLNQWHERGIFSPIRSYFIGDDEPDDYGDSYYMDGA